MLQEKEYTPDSPRVIFYTFNLKEIAETVLVNTTVLSYPVNNFIFISIFA